MSNHSHDNNKGALQPLPQQILPFRSLTALPNLPMAFSLLSSLISFHPSDIPNWVIDIFPLPGPRHYCVPLLIFLTSSLLLRFYHGTYAGVQWLWWWWVAWEEERVAELQ